MSIWLAVVGCGGDEPSGDSLPPVDTEDPAPQCPPVEPPAERVEGTGPRPGRRVEGAMTFQLDFDAAAEAAGYVDCGYTRTLAGDEYMDQPWLCASCLASFETDTVVDDFDCYAQIGTAAERHVEWIGFSDDDLWRAVEYPNTELAGYCVGGCTTYSYDGAVAYLEWSSTGNPTPDFLHTYSLDVTGDFTVTEDAAPEVTPLDGYRTEPYECGWPLGSPGGPSPWFGEVGGLFPNVRLPDQCGEPFDLWDLRGHYVILVSDTTFNEIRDGYDPFRRILENLRLDCVPVELVVILGDQYTNGEPSTAVVKDFARFHDLTGPVLGERGVTYSLFADVGGFESLFPGGGVIDPDGTLLQVFTQYDRVNDFEAAIRRDFGAR